jgi:sphingosine kinase
MGYEAAACCLWKSVPVALHATWKGLTDAESQVRKRFKVIINPFGGRGNAYELFEKSCRPILEAANCSLDVHITEYSGHAIEIAEKLDLDAYDAIMCCSGDGVPHEVFNGLAKRHDGIKALKSMPVCQLPGGSGNGMCWNLTGTGDASAATLSIIKSIRTPLDLISITQGNNRLLSFLSQSVGIIAEVDLGTEDLRWMGGARFTYGLLQRVWKRTAYPCDIAVKVAIEDKDEIRDHYRRGGSKEYNTEEPEEKGLPDLKYGDINSELPADWELVHHPHMGNFYSGNVRSTLQVRFSSRFR